MSIGNKQAYSVNKYPAPPFFYANELQDKLTRGFLLPHYIVLIFCYWSNSTKPFVFFRNTFLKRLLLLHRILGKWKCNIIFSRSVATSPIRAHTRFHLRQTTALCFDDGNENAGKATLPHYTFLYIFLPSMHDFEVKLPNFTFYGGRQTGDVELSFLFLNLDSRLLGVQRQERSPMFDKERE